MVIGITIELTAAGGQQLPSRQFTWPSRFVRHAIALSLSVNLGKSLGRIAVFENRAGLTHLLSRLCVLLDLKPLGVLFYSKSPKYRAILPQKIVLSMIIANRDNSRTSYPQWYPGYLLAIVIYTALENRGRESYKEEVF